MEWRGQAPASAYSAFDEILAPAFLEIADEPMLQMDIAIALKEVLSNVREHAYQLDMTKPIYLSVNVTEAFVMVVVMDIGLRWRADGTLEKDGAQERLLERMGNQLEQRGNGLLLIASCTDYTKFLRGGCVCVMRWNRHYRDNGNGKAHG